ncbi:MAG: 30S ribosomal protein S18 [Elusimicrobia bacterium]|nr:30S ribosomal protein S18 [Elusimicrobiota bacterium]
MKQDSKTEITSGSAPPNGGQAAPSGKEFARGSRVAADAKESGRRPAHKSYRRPYSQKKKMCRLCGERIKHVDYKQVQIVRTFCTETGKILPRRITGLCAGHQRQITRAVKINRNLSIMQYAG